MRFRNTIFGILSFLIAGLLLHIFRETSWAIFAERFLEEVAHSLHIERAAMIATLSQILIGGGLLWAVVYFAFRVGKMERPTRPDPILEAARTHAEAIRAQTEALKARNPPAEAEAPKRIALDPTWTRDTTLLQALWRAYSGNWNGRQELNDPEGDDAGRLYVAGNEIRQHAFEGILPIWARKRTENLWEVVPPVFWSNHEIEVSYSIASSGDDIWVKVTRPLVVGEVPHARTMAWTDFMTSRAAIEKLWPATTTAEPDKRSPAPSFPTWIELERRFRELEGPLQDSWVHCQTGAAGEHWRLAGPVTQDARDRFNAVARMASSKLFREFPDEIAPHKELSLETDPEIRWYKALQYIGGRYEHRNVVTQLNDDGSDNGDIFTGMINSPATASATLCHTIVSYEAS